jgi:hypothetical protein
MLQSGWLRHSPAEAVAVVGTDDRPGVATLDDMIDRTGPLPFLPGNQSKKRFTR